MNYLELCQRFVSDLGLSGGTGPVDVTGQVGQLKNVANWIADAALDVDNLWLDWKYLWVKYSQTVQIGNQFAPSTPNVGVRLWDPERMRIRKPGGSWGEMQYYPRKVFNDMFDDSGDPGWPNSFTILPDNRIQLNCFTDGVYEIKGEFWRRPVRLKLKTDVPLIPDEYFRIIIARASIIYGDREDAPEVISGAGAEYVVVKDQLESDQLEDQERRHSSTDRLASDRSSNVHSQYLR